MGFWIYYKVAIRGEKKELKRIQRKFNRVINKNQGDLNAFRDYLRIRPGGMADYANPFGLNGDTLSAWMGIRCNWMDPFALTYAIREKIGPKPIEIFFLVDECDLDPGEEFPLVTNDASHNVFAEDYCGRQVVIANETI